MRCCMRCCTRCCMRYCMWVHVRCFFCFDRKAGKSVKCKTARSVHGISPSLHSTWLKAGENLLERCQRERCLCAALAQGLSGSLAPSLARVVWQSHCLRSSIEMQCFWANFRVLKPLSIFRWMLSSSHCHFQKCLFCFVRLVFGAVADKARPSRSEACFCGWTTL